MIDKNFWEVLWWSWYQSDDKSVFRLLDKIFCLPAIVQRVYLPFLVIFFLMKIHLIQDNRKCFQLSLFQFYEEERPQPSTLYYLLVILIFLKPDKLKQSLAHYFSDSFKKNVFGVENLLWEFAFNYFPFQKGVRSSNRIFHIRNWFESFEVIKLSREERRCILKIKYQADFWKHLDGLFPYIL